MYNRYIPQPDGTYRRNRMHDPALPQPRTAAAPNAAAPEPTCPPPPPETCPKREEKHKSVPRQSHRQETGTDSFLRQLLPKDFDTGDILVLLLLLLMAGDSEEGRNNAILTMALYFLM